MKHEPCLAIHMEKQPGWACKLGGRVSADLQGRSHSVSQVDGVSDMASAYKFCVGRFTKGTKASAHLDARHFGFSLHSTGAFQAATLVLVSLTE